MTIIAPDVSSRLKPDFIGVVHTIYTEFCNLQRDARVLVLSDARTPDYVVATFQGMAQALGAEAATIESSIPFGGPTYQPSVKWSRMLAGAAREADLLVDMGIGYAEFVVEAIDRGARVIMPGDGIGNPYLEDILIRTIRDVDIHKIRREADRIADLFSRASTCKLLSGDDDELVIDISGLQGSAADGFLWDKDKSEFKSSYGILPPAQPGITLPRGRANGTVSVDGTVLWHPIYHEEPRKPLKLSFDAGRLVDIGGDSYLSNRIRQWLPRARGPRSVRGSQSPEYRHQPERAADAEPGMGAGIRLGDLRHGRHVRIGGTLCPRGKARVGEVEGALGLDGQSTDGAAGRPCSDQERSGFLKAFGRPSRRGC